MYKTNKLFIATLDLVLLKIEKYLCNYIFLSYVASGTKNKCAVISCQIIDSKTSSNLYEKYCIKPLHIKYSIALS